MTISDDIEDYVAAALRSNGGLITAAGTVASSPSAVSTDPLTVVLDGSAYAVPVKQFRAFPVFPGMRVGLILIGTEWVVIGSFSDAGTATAGQRMLVGANIPPELASFGVQVAFLFYDTDAVSGLEVGYFFIGISNILDSPAIQKVMLFGACKYPVPGDPTSPTTSNVKTAHQINLDGFTWFKDYPVRFLSSVGVINVEPTINLLGTVNVHGDLLYKGATSPPWGINFASADVNSSAAIGTTETAVMGLAGITYRAGRAYKFSFGQMFQANTAGALVFTRARAGGANTDPVYGEMGRFPCTVANTPFHGEGHTYVANSTGSDITGREIWLHISASVGTVQHRAVNPDTPRWILLEDVGPASGYPMAHAV
ncbi:hypothetical protein [Micromonospora sp. NPDC004551]|uniref:hypothetical protein n=1 Tax=Micromonospora sp. NPDC004551 TaxID=3154284 RepID=UPI0033A68636